MEVVLLEKEASELTISLFSMREYMDMLRQEILRQESVIWKGVLTKNHTISAH